jgi:hypothetical protein
MLQYATSSCSNGQDDGKRNGGDNDGSKLGTQLRKQRNGLRCSVGVVTSRHAREGKSEEVSASVNPFVFRHRQPPGGIEGGR